MPKGKKAAAKETLTDPLEIREILKAASPDAARALAQLVRSPDPRVALAACSAILNRTQGRPRAGEADMDMEKEKDKIAKRALTLAKKLAMQADDNDDPP